MDVGRCGVGTTPGVTVNVFGPKFRCMRSLEILDIICREKESGIKPRLEGRDIPLKGMPRESEARKKSCARAVVVPPLEIAIGPS